MRTARGLLVVAISVTSAAVARGQLHAPRNQLERQVLKPRADALKDSLRRINAEVDSLRNAKRSPGLDSTLKILLEKAKELASRIKTAQAGPNSTMFGSLVAQFHPNDRAYLESSVVSGYLGNAFGDVSIARVVSASDTSSDIDKRKRFQDRDASVTTLVNNGGEETFRVVLPTWELSSGAHVSAHVSLYPEFGISSPVDSVPNGYRFTGGGAVELPLTIAWTKKAKPDTSFILILAGRVSQRDMFNAPIVSDINDRWLPAYQFVGGISLDKTIVMGIAITALPKAFQPYMPKYAIVGSSSVF